MRDGNLLNTVPVTAQTLLDINDAQPVSPPPPPQTPSPARPPSPGSLPLPSHLPGAVEKEQLFSHLREEMLKEGFVGNAKYFILAAFFQKMYLFVSFPAPSFVSAVALCRAPLGERGENCILPDN